MSAIEKRARLATLDWATVDALDAAARVLAANPEVRERCNQLRHSRSAAPERLATRPNELWI